MTPLVRFLQSSIELLFTPIITFVPQWEKDDRGHRLLKMLIDIVVLPSARREKKNLWF